MILEWFKNFFTLAIGITLGCVAIVVLFGIFWAVATYIHPTATLILTIISILAWLTTMMTFMD